MLAKCDSQPFIIGCGFAGKYLARLLRDQNLSPFCIVKSDASVKALQADGFNGLSFDLDICDWGHFQNDFTSRDIYYLVAPNNTLENDPRLDAFLLRCKQMQPRRIVYISTSGVYGDCYGEWVTETHETKPLTARALRRKYAEDALIRTCHHISVEYIILRVGGIYGSERLPINRLSTIEVLCPQDAPFSNRIHVYDLAQSCFAAMRCKVANEVINVSDGHPTTMTDYYYQIADLAGLPRPACVPLSQAKDKLSPSMLSFVNESRRLSTRKMQKLLNITLRFPTLAKGLQACFQQLQDKNV